ncbi:MAG: aryl-sulfate sulfotransferase [Bacteroidia bacterium]|nr:aryl-sulfate sulfotransferase [Bacteroidia bacterium]
MKNKLLLALLTIVCLTNNAQQTLGLLQNEPGAMDGYVLFAPLMSHNTYLIDKCGREVHEWKSNYRPGQSAYLLPDGNLLRCANDSNLAFVSSGGRIEKFDWNNNLIWSYAISTPTSCLHHDIYPMPNGNILAILWEKKTPEEAKAKGRKPELLGKSIWSERIIELKPKGKNMATIVWEWNVWDHLINDHDIRLPNYGEVATNPQLININYKASADEDWLHFNTVCYNAELNQVMISNRNFSEIYIVDHSTSMKQSATHSGGKYKKGGDLLYRWGNPAAYNCGTVNEQDLYLQHSPHWIAKGLSDAGKILIFNNGAERAPEPYSVVEIIEPPIDKLGNYTVEKGKAFLPAKPSWTFRDSMPQIFYSKNVSNAQRLPNGNMLICEGANGKFFEINPEKRVVWKYVNPVSLKGSAEQGAMYIQNQVFRCMFYPSNYSGFKGKDLSPGKPLEINPVSMGCTQGGK